MGHERWTRISLEGEDYFDVVESYEEVKSRISSANGLDLLEFISISGYRCSVRVRNVSSFYEHGLDIFKSIWEHSKELDELKKQTIGWEQ